MTSQLRRDVVGPLGRATRSVGLGSLADRLEAVRDWMQDDLIDLESEKTNSGANWTARDERTMRDRDKALADLKVQRDRLFTRILDQP